MDELKDEGQETKLVIDADLKESKDAYYEAERLSKKSIEIAYLSIFVALTGLLFSSWINFKIAETSWRIDLSSHEYNEPKSWQPSPLEEKMDTIIKNQERLIEIQDNK